MRKTTPHIRLTRRAILAGLAGGATFPAWADAPVRTPRPPRRGAAPSETVTPVDDLVARSRLEGRVSFVVADARTGKVLESHEPALTQPPASTAKALTTLYALERLGPEHRFATRLLATGPIENGRVMGDLVLAGGGDPTLDTVSLAAMVADLKALGVREVGGNLRVWTGALPNMREIDEEQPRHVAYNPSIGGLNLNFNRVHFGWERQGTAYQVTMDGRGGSMIPGVRMARMQVVDRSSPIYTYADGDGRDDWTVARHALGASGSRWLPVRYPGLYAGEVLQVVLRAHGIMSGGDIGYAETDAGDLLVSHESAPLDEILTDMLYYSTNATAEAVGLAASQAAGDVRDLKGSAGAMNAWMTRTYGANSADLEDHSGLGDDSRISAADMVRALVAVGPDGPLEPLLKPYPVQDSPNFDVLAKTGTLNFVSALAGYIDGPGRTPLAFAIFCADTARRDTLSVEQRERPPGGQVWLNRARTLQRALLSRWGNTYTA